MAFDEQSRNDWENHRNLYEESTGREHDTGKSFRKSNSSSGIGCMVIFLVLALAAFITSCGKSVSVDSLGFPEYCPVNIDFKGEYSAIIDKEDNVWQWRYDKNYNIIDLQKVNVPKTRSIALDYKSGLGWAVTQTGEVYKWLLYDSSLNERVETDKPVAKMVAYNNHLIMLHVDGTVTSNEVAMRDLGILKSRYPPIQYELFIDIIDIILRNDVLLALTKNGDVFAACGSGISHLNIEGEPTKEAKPVKIEGLSKIKRIFHPHFAVYAIDENENVHYWGGNFRTKEIQTLDVQGSMVLTGERVIDSEGNNYRIIQNQKAKTNFRTSLSDLPFPNGYGLWYMAHYNICKKVIGLDKDGKLWLFDFKAGYGVEERTVSNPIRIGDFKVKMVYFKP